MISRAKTDVERSLSADEFIWNEEGLTHAHAYIEPTLLAWLSSSGAETVLDLGCGNGALTNELGKQGLEVTGVDVSDSGVSIASKAYPDVPFLRADLEVPLPEHLHHAFDAVVAIEVIEHLLRPRSLLERAKEALRPGGIVIVSTPYHGYLKNFALALTNSFDNHWHPLRDYGHVKFFSRKTILQLFAEQNFFVTGFSRVGRIPSLAKSMMVRAIPKVRRCAVSDLCGEQPVKLLRDAEYARTL